MGERARQRDRAAPDRSFSPVGFFAMVTPGPRYRPVRRRRPHFALPALAHHGSGGSPVARPVRRSRRRSRRAGLSSCCAFPAWQAKFTASPITVNSSCSPSPTAPNTTRPDATASPIDKGASPADLRSAAHRSAASSTASAARRASAAAVVDGVTAPNEARMPSPRNLSMLPLRAIRGRRPDSPAAPS